MLGSSVRHSPNTPIDFKAVLAIAQAHMQHENLVRRSHNYIHECVDTVHGMNSRHVQESLI